MKKILSALLIVFGLYSIASAQVRTSDEFGLDIGYNAANVSYPGSYSNSDYTSGFNLGFSAEHYFSNRWSIKGKLIYDQKGWGNGYLILPDNSEIDGVDYHLNYLTIPIMANWHFGRTRNWYLHFGPYLGFLLSTSESSNSGQDIKGAFNSTDVGLDVGIGVKFPVSNHVKLFIEADGQGGFNNIFKYSDGTVQNERSSINFGVLFPLR
jgi:opacity protein-like surface antigen